MFLKILPFRRNRKTWPRYHRDTRIRNVYTVQETGSSSNHRIFRKGKGRNYSSSQHDSGNKKEDRRRKETGTWELGMLSRIRDPALVKDWELTKPVWTVAGGESFLLPGEDYRDCHGNCLPWSVLLFFLLWPITWQEVTQERKGMLGLIRRYSPSSWQAVPLRQEYTANTLSSWENRKLCPAMKPQGLSLVAQFLLLGSTFSETHNIVKQRHQLETVRQNTRVWGGGHRKPRRWAAILGLAPIFSSSPSVKLFGGEHKEERTYSFKSIILPHALKFWLPHTRRTTTLPHATSQGFWWPHGNATCCPGKFNTMLTMLWASHCSSSILGAETSQQALPMLHPLHLQVLTQPLQQVFQWWDRRGGRRQEAKCPRCIPSSSLESQWRHG